MLLIVLTLGLMLSFVMTSLEERNISEHQDYLFTQANILSNTLIAEFLNLSQPHTNDYYTDVVKDFSKEIGARIIVADQEGRILIDSYSEFSSEDSIRNKELNKSLKGTQSSDIYRYDDIGRVVYVAVPIVNQTDVIGSILITSSLEPIYESLSKLLNSLFVLAIVCIGFTVATSFIFVEIIASPVEKLTELVNRVAFGKYDEKIEVEGNDEIKVLSNSFNTMMTKLDQVDTQRKQFVANVSHELRTPLTSIKILSSSLISDEATKPEIYKEFLMDIDSEVDRLNEIIDGLLYLVDLEKKELELHYTNTKINFLLTKVIYLLRPLAEQKNILIEIQAEDKVWASVDKAKLHQCLSNIIANAIKYNRENGHVLVNLVNKRSTFVIQVIDDGFGIAEESLPFVFDRFYRTDKARNRKSGGTGLGLSIVQQIVHLHQGEISIESELNKGTTVTIEIPKGII
ncbi:MAG: HAMP domain-containing protein [Clostridiales bacterium]|nr:HAMP domain-containing protein [Clostridiales bacterium]